MNSWVLIVAFVVEGTVTTFGVGTIHDSETQCADIEMPKLSHSRNNFSARCMRISEVMDRYPEGLKWY